MISETKRCPGCDTRKPRGEFHRNRSQHDGLATLCKPCNRARVARWEKENKTMDRVHCSTYRLRKTLARTPLPRPGPNVFPRRMFTEENFPGERVLHGSTAVHEAAHAVVMWQHGALRDVSIFPRPRAKWLKGALVPRGLQTLVYCVGEAAEWLAYSSDSHWQAYRTQEGIGAGAGPDLKNMLKELGIKASPLAIVETWEKAVAHARQHWPAILAVANALCAREKLNGAEVGEIIGQLRPDHAVRLT